MVVLRSHVQVFDLNISLVLFHFPSTREMYQSQGGASYTSLCPVEDPRDIIMKPISVDGSTPLEA